MGDTEFKVGIEIRKDEEENGSRILRGMAAVLDAYPGREGKMPFTMEAVERAGNLLDGYGLHPSETRIVEWLSYVLRNRAKIKPRSTDRLPATHTVTDMHDFKRKKLSDLDLT